MIVRASTLFLPTLREDPAGAESVSHRLLVRGGFIRQGRAGVWTHMPLGGRVHRKVEQVIREEMDAIGGQEMLMPVLTPAELCKETGRYSIPELFKLHDRVGREFVLPMTHEETVTFHAREIRSYRELPKILYHLSVTDRDEPRPRGGLLRVREFIMKDAYSFDRDEAGLDESFRKHAGAYKRIFERCGIEALEVAAEAGIMGGSGSRDFLAPADSGENTPGLCANGDYAADLPPPRPRRRDRPRPRRERRLRRRHRDRVRRAVRARLSGAARRAGGSRDAGAAADRGGLAVPRRRCPRDRAGAARGGRRHGRARARPRRRSAQRDEAARRPRRDVPARRGGRDPRYLRRERRDGW